MNEFSKDDGPLPTSDAASAAANSDEVKKYRYAFLPTFAAILCGGLVVASVLIFINHGPKGFLELKAIALSILVGTGFGLFVTTMIVVSLPVFVTRAYLASTDWHGEYQAVAWSDISTVKRLNLLGLRFLLVNGTIFVPLFLADKKGFLDTVREHVGREDNLLVQALERSF